MRLFLVISLAMSLGACSSATPVAEPVVTTSASTTTTEATGSTTTALDPEAADRAEIEDVLTRFYGYVYENGFVEGAPGLEDLATTPIYESTVEALSAGAGAGYVIGDGMQALRILSITVRGDVATGTICRLDEASVHDANGTEIAPFTPDTRVLEFGATRDNDSGWRVSNSTRPPGEDVPCDM